MVNHHCCPLLRDGKLSLLSATKCEVNSFQCLRLYIMLPMQGKDLYIMLPMQGKDQYKFLDLTGN